MKVLMSDEEKSFVMVLCTLAIWILVGISARVAFVSGIIESGVQRILSSSFLMTMVIEAILATIIMALGVVSYYSVKQNNAYRKAQNIIKNDTEDDNRIENIVE